MLESTKPKDYLLTIKVVDKKKKKYEDFFKLCSEMFRVLENLDGSTSIFCNETGRLVCTIRGQPKSMGLGGRPVNVVEPTPQNRRSCYYNVAGKPECLLEVEDEKNTRDKVLEVWDEPKEDFDNDSVAPDEFARCLNLVSKERLKSESMDQLKSTFPLRYLPRTKEILVGDNLRDLKLPDDLPLTSSLGFKIMKLNHEKTFYSDQNIEMKINNYNSFCRFPLNTSTVCGNFPKLRCRDKKEYPVCTSQKLSKYSPTHMYTFNRRQRLEKLITFKTGLDTRSRRLLQRCNKRLAVNIKRLAPDEIATWLQKRSKRGPITPDCIIEEKPVSSGADFDLAVIEEYVPPYIDVESLSSDSSDSEENSNDPSFVCNSRNEAMKLKAALNVSKTSHSLSPLKKNGQLSKWLKKSPMFENCFVKVVNVLNKLQKCYGGYYIVGSNINVPFCQDFLNRLDPKVRNSIVIPETSGLRTDHVYRRPFSQVVSRKRFLSNSQCLNRKTPKTKKIEERTKTKIGIQSKSSAVKLSNIKNSSLTSVLSKNMPTVSIIPIIDLTDDPVLPVKRIRDAQKRKICNWKFHCYGCNFTQKFIDEVTAHSIATEHLKEFHYVADVKSFLNIKKSPKTGAILEAFPGYNS